MTFNILKPQDLDKLQEKLKVTQRLLDKLDLEFSLPHNQNKDFKQFLEKSTSTLNIYELCGNEFCFELDLLQLPIVSLFFKRYTLGYHRQISCFLKVLAESPQYFLPKNVKEPEKQAKTEEDVEKNVVKKDQKFEQSNILLRNQVALLSSNNDLLLRQNQQLKEMVSKFEKEKKELEEELIRTVKSTIISQNEYIEGSTANKNKGMMSVDEFLASLKKSPAPTAKSPYGNREEAHKTTNFSAKSPSLVKDEEHKKIDEDELDFEEMKRVLEKRDKTFEKVKESGVSKELKQVLKGIAKKKPVEVFQTVSYHEEEDGESKEEGSPLTSTMKKKVSILTNNSKNPVKKEAKKAMTTIQMPTSTQKVSCREVGTQPDKLIFDIDVIDALNFKINQQKSQINQLNAEISGKQQVISLKEDEKNALKKEFDKEKLRNLEFIKRITSLEQDFAKQKKEINELRGEKAMAEEKAANYNDMIDDLVSQLKEKDDSVPSDTEKTQFKMKFLESRQEIMKKNDEIKVLNIENQELKEEIERLKAEILGLLNESNDFKCKYENLQMESEILLNDLKKIQQQNQGLLTINLENIEKNIVQSKEFLEKKRERDVPAPESPKKNGAKNAVNGKRNIQKNKKIENNTANDSNNNNSKIESSSKIVEKIEKEEKLEEESNNTDQINEGLNNLKNQNREKSTEKLIASKKTDSFKSIKNKNVKEKRQSQSIHYIQPNYENEKEKEKENEKLKSANNQSEKTEKNENIEKIENKIEKNSLNNTSLTQEKIHKENSRKQEKSIKNSSDTIDLSKANEKISKFTQQKQRTEKSLENTEKTPISNDKNTKNINSKAKQIMPDKTTTPFEEKNSSSINNTKQISNKEKMFKTSTENNNSFKQNPNELNQSSNMMNATAKTKANQINNNNNNITLETPIKTNENIQKNFSAKNKISSNDKIFDSLIKNHKENERFKTPEPIKNFIGSSTISQENQKKVQEREKLLKSFEEMQQEKKMLQTEISKKNEYITNLEAQIQQFLKEKIEISQKIQKKEENLKIALSIVHKSTQTSFEFDSKETKKPKELQQTSTKLNQIINKKKGPLPLLDNLYFQEKSLLEKFSFDSVKSSENLLLSLNFSKLKEFSPSKQKEIENEQNFEEIFQLLQRNIEFPRKNQENVETYLGFNEFIKEKKVPKYEEFKEIMKNIIEEHKKCGPKCPHLQRFYDRLGFSELKANRKPFKIHKRNLSRLLILPPPNSSSDINY